MQVEYRHGYAFSPSAAIAKTARNCNCSMAPAPQLALLSKDPAAAYAKRCLVTGSLRECHAGTASELTLTLPAMPAKTHSSVKLCASVWLRAGHAERVTHSAICVPRVTRSALLTYGPVQAAGQYLLAVTAEGFHVPGSPFVLRCVAAAPTAPQCLRGG